MIVPIDDPLDQRLVRYAAVSDPRLARDHGLFVAEGRLVVERLISCRRFEVESVLVSPTALSAMSLLWAALPEHVPVFVLPADQFQRVAGINVHRGCLALARRGSSTSLEETLQASRRVLVLEGIGNADNVGGIFRNAAAFAVDAVVLGPGCCDPLYRKSIRTSMAATLVVPFTIADPWPEALASIRDRGFSILALTPRSSALTLEQVVQGGVPQKWAMVLGAEGGGLTEAALAHADTPVRIPTSDAVDSLNVAVACGIALARLSAGATL